MSNATQKHRMVELAKVRAIQTGFHEKPKVYRITAIQVHRGRFEDRRVGWTKPNGERGGCTMLVRSATTEVHVGVRAR